MVQNEKLNENSATLWHKCLGHISKQRIQRLMLDEILDPLDLSDFEVCIECIKGKQTNIRKLGAKRAKDVLKLYMTKKLRHIYWNPRDIRSCKSRKT